MLTSIAHLKGDHSNEKRLLEGLGEIFERGIKTFGEFDHYRSPKLHASEMSSECQRKAVYSLMDAPRTKGVPPKWKKRFMVGHVLHDLIQKVLAEGLRGVNATFIPEARVTAELNAVAREWDFDSSCDGLISFHSQETGEEVARAIVEIKSMSPDEFEDLKKPKPEHVIQSHLYMKCLDAPYCWFIYWNKGNQNYTGSNLPNFLMPFDAKVWDLIERRAADAHMHAADKTMPERVEGIHCEFCSFRQTCGPKYLNKNIRPEKLRGVLR